MNFSFQILCFSVPEFLFDFIFSFITLLQFTTFYSFITFFFLTSLCTFVIGKESLCNAGDPGSIPGSGISPGERNGYSLQYSCLENSMVRGAWWLQSLSAFTPTGLIMSHFSFTTFSLDESLFSVWVFFSHI